MKSVLKKTFKIIRSVVCWACIIVLVFALVTVVIAKINGTNPSVFGYSIYRVSSGSMSPELEVGDVILGKAVDDPMEIKVDDVVTYEGRGELSGKLITHKVIVAPHEEEGILMLQTKGIANEIPDSPIEADRVVSVVITKVAFLTAFYDFFFSPWGLLTAVVLIILVFIDELIVMIRTITGNDNRKKPENIDDIIGRIQSEGTDKTLIDDESSQNDSET